MVDGYFGLPGHDTARSGTRTPKLPTAVITGLSAFLRTTDDHRPDHTVSLQRITVYTKRIKPQKPQGAICDKRSMSKYLQLHCPSTQNSKLR